MKELKISNFQDYIKIVEGSFMAENFENYPKERILLYRGQSKNYNLLPAIARKNPSENTKEKEIRNLKELKIRSYGIIEKSELVTDWDWLVYAQHYGLHTRLLDWSINPLVALFFACNKYSDNYNDDDSYVYIFIGGEENLVNDEKDLNPFEIKATKILRPKPNNKRIVAQSGWFTAHKYSDKDNQFVSLNSHKGYKDQVYSIKIPHELKHNLMEILNKLGVNYLTMFPDSEGLCKQINWDNK
jgi:hypothetical protein